MGADGFDSAREMLGWAIEDIDEFDAITEHFVLNEAYTRFTERDVETGGIAHKVRVAPLPPRLRKLATNALWCIKHAADHGMREAIAVVTASDPGDVHFLVSSHPNDMRSRLTKPGSKYPAALHNLIESFEIYPRGNGYAGGNDEFCILNKLANDTKHAVALVANPTTAIMGARGTGKIGGARLYFPTPLKSGENELTLAVVPDDPDAEMNIEIATQITFDGHPALARAPATTWLEGWANAVANAVDQLEAEAALVAGRMG